LPLTQSYAQNPFINLNLSIWDFLVLFEQLLTKLLVMKNGLSRLKYVQLSLMLIAFGVQSYSQINLNSPIPTDPAVIKGKLPNGLTYYIRKNAIPEKKAQLRLVVNVGSVLEDKDQQGLAHFMEHMNFNGSTHFPKNELVSYLQTIGVEFGADLNAYTSFDETVYILPIPTDNPEKIEKGFTVLEDWAGNALLETEEINKERGVVLEESRLGKGANERMGKKYFPRLFNGSQYSNRLPIGKDSILKNFQPATLKRFYKTWYRPNLEAVIVVGDIDPKMVEQQIKAHFSAFKNPNPPKTRPAIIPIPTRTKNEAMVLTDKEQTNTLLEVYNFIEKETPTHTWAGYRKTLAEGLFSIIVNQRLNQLTQQAEPPFVFGNASFGNFIRGYRAFSTFALIGDKPVKDAIDALVTTTETVKKYGLLQSELDRAKSSLMNQIERSYADKDKTESARFVQEYIDNFLSDNPITGIANRYNFIKQVLPGISLAEVNAVASKMETNQGKFALLLAPEKDAAKLPGSSQLLNTLAAAHRIPVKPYAESAVASVLVSNPPTPGKITAESTNKTLGTTDLTLSNGVTITIRPTDFKNDEIQMDGWRWGGSRNYTLADKENAENSANIVREMGVKDMSPTDLQKFLAGKTVSVTPYVNSLEDGIEGGSSVKDFETFLQLVYLSVTQPRKDPALFKAYISGQKAFLQNVKANPFAYFSDSLARLEYQNNPWVEDFPTAADFDKINLDRSFDIYKEIFNNAWGWHFSFVGNMDVEKAKPLLETWLGGLPSAQKENKFTDVGLRPVKGVVKADIYRGRDNKSLVNIVFTGEATYSREESLKLQVLMEVLNIKFTEQLREAMSLIYGGGMNGGLSKRPYANYVVQASFPCGPENVDKLTTAFFDIIRNAQEKGFDQKDLDKVKETLKKQNEDQMKSNDHWLNTLTRSWIEREDPQWIYDYSKKVQELTTTDIQDAARKYLNLNNYVKGVLYPEKN